MISSLRFMRVMLTLQNRWRPRSSMHLPRKPLFSRMKALVWKPLSAYLSLSAESSFSNLARKILGTYCTKRTMRRNPTGYATV